MREPGPREGDQEVVHTCTCAHASTEVVRWQGGAAEGGQACVVRVDAQGGESMCA